MPDSQAAPAKTAPQKPVTPQQRPKDKEEIAGLKATVKKLREANETLRGKKRDAEEQLVMAEDTLRLHEMRHEQADLAHKERETNLIEMFPTWFQQMFGMPRGLVPGKFIEQCLRPTVEQHYPRVRKSAMRCVMEGGLDVKPFIELPVSLQARFYQTINFCDLIETMWHDHVSYANPDYNNQEDIDG